MPFPVTSLTAYDVSVADVSKTGKRLLTKVGESMLHAVSTFPNWIDPDTGHGSEKPYDADHDPAGEELLAENVARAVLRDK